MDEHKDKMTEDEYYDMLARAYEDEGICESDALDHVLA